MQDLACHDCAKRIQRRRVKSPFNVSRLSLSLPIPCDVRHRRRRYYSHCKPSLVVFPTYVSHATNVFYLFIYLFYLVYPSPLLLELLLVWLLWMDCDTCMNMYDSYPAELSNVAYTTGLLDGDALTGNGRFWTTIAWCPFSPLDFDRSPVPRAAELLNVGLMTLLSVGCRRTIAFPVMFDCRRHYIVQSFNWIQSNPIINPCHLSTIINIQ